jgi:hypothetical protein
MKNAVKLDREVLSSLRSRVKAANMSGSTSRRKGHTAEQAVVKALKQLGVNAMTARAATGGFQSGADILCDLPVIIEVKNQSRDNLPGWLDQARSQADDAPGAVVHKRHGKADAANWFVTMQLDDFVNLVKNK